MIVKITNELWIDLKEILTILPNDTGLVIYYKNCQQGTRIPEDLKWVLLEKLNELFDGDVKEVWGPTT